jgi:hypothetical protein
MHQECAQQRSIKQGKKYNQLNLNDLYILAQLMQLNNYKQFFSCMLFVISLLSTC